MRRCVITIDSTLPSNNASETGRTREENWNKDTAVHAQVSNLCGKTRRPLTFEALAKQVNDLPPRPFVSPLICVRELSPSMAGTALIQALNDISPTYGRDYAHLFHNEGFPDPVALATLRETDAPSVPLGVRRAVIGKLGERFRVHLPLF